MTQKQYVYEIEFRRNKFFCYVISSTYVSRDFAEHCFADELSHITSQFNNGVISYEFWWFLNRRIQLALCERDGR